MKETSTVFCILFELNSNFRMQKRYVIFYDETQEVIERIMKNDIREAFLEKCLGCMPRILSNEVEKLDIGIS